MALFGNFFMILLIFQDTRLHTPILSQLPFIDLNYISTIVPKMACNFPLGNKYLLHWMWNAELLLHDFSRYRSIVVDIYGLWSLCGDLLSSSLSHQNQQNNVCVDDNRITDNGSINCCAHTIYAFQISYCRSRAINHFFCDVPTMLTLAYIDSWIYEYTVLVSTSFFLLLPFTGIAFSYAHVLFAVCHMQSP